MIYTTFRCNKEILIVDFSDCDENQMIALVDEASKILTANNKSQLLLSVYNDRAYATPKFMNAVRVDMARFIHLIEKQAIVGLNETKKIILTGFNLTFDRNVRAFDTREEAISFLIDESTTDKDVPEYLR